MKRLAVLLGVVLALLLGGAAPASAEPTAARVETLPPVAGLTFTFEGSTYVTGADGTVAVPRHVRAVELAVKAREVSLGNGDVARFDRWYTRSGSKVRRVTAAMSTFRKVGFRFVNLEGETVDRATLDAVTLKSSTGFLVQLPADRTDVVMQATRVVSESGGPVVKDIYFTVSDVEVEGNSIVNRSQTKFFPRTARSVEVPLLFFDATVRARDALFGFAVKGTLVLEYPNGHTVTHRLGADGRVALPGLPRGQYHLSVEGPGLKLVQPVTMSREQDVDLKVFSYLDIGVVLGTGLAVAGGLLLAGRRLHRRRLAVPTGAPMDVVKSVPDVVPERPVGAQQPTRFQVPLLPVELREPGDPSPSAVILTRHLPAPRAELPTVPKTAFYRLYLLPPEDSREGAQR